MTMTVMYIVMMKDYFTCMWLAGVGVNRIQLSVTLLSCHTRSVGHPDHQGVLILLPFYYLHHQGFLIFLHLGAPHHQAVLIFLHL